MKFTCIITAHDEGRMADATMQSVLRSIAYWQTQDAGKQTYEILVQIDNGSRETLEYFHGYQADEHVRIVTCSSGDVGPARNQAAKQANGDLVFFVDGDDLVSENYISEILKILEKHPSAVVSPEFSIGFSDDGRSGSVFRMADSKTKEHDAFLLFNVNLWTAAIAGKRATFLKHPYMASTEGYGHEDYALNIDLVADGVAHLIAPQTVYFYREKSQSRRTQNDQQRVVTPYSSLFEPEFWRQAKFAQQIQLAANPNRLAWLKRLYLKTRQNRWLRAAAEKTRAKLSRKFLSDLPEKVRAEWCEIAKLEPAASLSKQKNINAMGIHGVNTYCPASLAYYRLCQAHPDFANIDFETIAQGIDADQQDLLLSRIMVQSRGRASFTNPKILQKWRALHRALDESLKVK